MITNRESALDDLYYELAMLDASARVDFLDELVRAHPEHARELTDFAVDLAFDDRSAVEATPEMAAEDDPIVMRAMSKFQNLLYNADHAVAAPSNGVSHETARRTTNLDQTVNPFAELDHVEIRRVAKELNAPTLLVIKLRDRHILPATISPGFRKKTVEVLGVPEPILAAHLMAPPEAQHARRYKSERKPEATTQQTFEEAVNSLDVSDDQRRYLLGL